MKRVVVTGGGGFIGSAIARALLKRGDAVTVIGRSFYPELAALGITCLQGDITDSVFMEKALAGTDLVFHVAARAGVWGSLRSYLQTNVTGTATCIRACEKNQVPALVHTSTPSVVFDRHDLEGVDESTPYASRTLCHYATSKIIAEKLVLQANTKNLRTTAIRPHLVWGAGDPHLIPRLLERGKSGELRRIGAGRNRLDITHVDNVVHAHLLAGDNLLGGATAAGLAFFIGDREPVRLWEWVNDLLKGFGIEPVRKTLPLQAAYWLGGLLELGHALFSPEREPKMTRFVALQLARSHWFSHGLAERILGYTPLVTPSKGMVEVFADERFWSIADRQATD